MDDTRVHHPTTPDRVERIQRELSRLRSKRPNLASRIEKAEALLVSHLSAPSPASRPVKVRVGADGARYFVVRSGSKLAREYRVDAPAFGCSCPARTTCYHSVASYVLDRVLFPQPANAKGTAKRERDGADELTASIAAYWRERPEALAAALDRMGD